MAVDRNLNDTLAAFLSSFVYSGPAVRVYNWAGVSQGGVVQYSSGVIPLDVPLSPNPQTISPGINFSMPPLGGAVQGPADGLLIIALDVNLTQRLANITVPGAYNLLATGGADFSPLDLAIVTHSDPANSFGDLAWRRALNWPAGSAEFLDISIQGGGFADGTYLSLNTAQLSLDSDPAGRIRAANIPLTPDTLHWFRVTTQVSGVFFISPVVQFQSAALQGGGTPTVSNVQVTFS